MPKNPLFSSYRTGENRVTASILAVLERVDLGVVERLLSAATGEANLPLVSFENQVAAKDGSVPDAGISANFRYLFEVKTTARALDRRQLEGHLAHSTGRSSMSSCSCSLPTPKSLRSWPRSTSEDSRG